MSTTITIQMILSICGGLIIMISETLPFIKEIKSNGIIHLLYNLIINKKEQDTTQHHDNHDENEQLLTNQNVHNNIQDNTITIHDVRDNISNLCSNLHNTNSTLELINNSRQLKLQTSELYELNYIINYIKVNYPKKIYKTKFLTKSNKQVLISQGYIIDYDFEHDMYSIKW